MIGAVVVVIQRDGGIAQALTSGPAPFAPACTGPGTNALLDGLARVTPSMLTSPATAVVTVKAELAGVRPGTVTTTSPAPRVAPAGTVVAIEVALLVRMVAVAPPILTVAPVNAEPAMVTGVPTGPVNGVTLIIAGEAGGGGATTVKGALAAVNPGTVTVTAPKPRAAPAGTLVEIVVPLGLVNAADAPPMVTTLAPEKLAPVIVTGVPTDAESGAAVAMMGAAGGGGTRTVNDTLAAVNPETVTTTVPTPGVAVAGTLVTIVDPVLLVIEAFAPPMVTVAPVKLAPLIVSAAFGKPLVTDRLAMLGGMGIGTMQAPVAMLITLAPKDTVAVEQGVPFKLIVCCA